MLGGYSKILDSTGFVYDSFKTGKRSPSPIII